jgi:UDP-N-acetylmuramoyl-tripeptide--D-alanyl-D-alanine ligase
MATPIPKNEASFTFGKVAKACGGQLRGGDPAGQVHGVTIDSRAVEPGELYVALKGERHDGHAYLAQAQAAGAAAALVSDASAAPPGLPLIVVADTRRALGDLALAHRRRWAGKLVAVTGSAGKTTTKELAAAALAGTGQRVLATVGNLNNDIGLPMTLFGLTRDHDVAVVEIGTSGPGEIARLAEICEPSAGIVTTVALAHVERLATLDAVADEKCALLRALPLDGVAIYGRDSAPLEARRATFTAGRVLGFGEGEGADVRIVRRELRADMTTHCKLDHFDPPRSLELDLKLFGPGPALDATAALALILAWQPSASVQPASAALGNVEPLPGRMRPGRGRAESLIIDDSYNANPASMRSSLAALRDLARLRKGRAIAVLGDMAELGAHSQAEHESLGLELVRTGVADAFLCGPWMAHAARTAREEVRRKRAKGPHVEHCADPAGAIPELMRSLSANDVVLVKGSRSMKMEAVVDALALDKAGAHE